MHAIIRQGNGKYYISAVFGYYKDITVTDEYERYLESINKPYWIVWNADKTKLIKWLNIVPNTKYIIPQILIVDSEHNNWNIDEDGVGCVDFLSKELINSFIDKETQPEDILNQCRSIDENYIYEEITEIKTKKDIENLEWVSGGFHDARIAKEELQNGILYLKFYSTCGCEIEVWFWGDVEYDTSSRVPEYYDPYCLGSTVILQDGFVYLADEDDLAVNDIAKRKYCYFKARHMKYRVIPD